MYLMGWLVWWPDYGDNYTRCQSMWKLLRFVSQFNTDFFLTWQTDVFHLFLWPKPNYCICINILSCVLTSILVIKFWCFGNILILSRKNVDYCDFTAIYGWLWNSIVTKHHDLQKRLCAKNLNFTYLNLTPGDGACFFKAIVPIFKILFYRNFLSKHTWMIDQ